MPPTSLSITCRFVRPIASIGAALALWLLVPSHAGAQGGGWRHPRGAFVARTTLEAQVVAADSAAADRKLSPEAREMRRAEGWVLKRRLTEGDFGIGDRIVLSVVGEASLTDTFTVRPGPELLLGNLPPLSLKGVLRSELQSHLTTELARYFVRPQVDAVPLLRVAVLGAIGRPGYYYVPADMLLSDLVMTAGGPGQADMKRAEIRRGDEALYAGRDVDVALDDGFTLDMLNLRSGDEFFLQEKRQLNWASLLRAVTIVSGIAALVVRISS